MASPKKPATRPTTVINVNASPPQRSAPSDGGGHGDEVQTRQPDNSKPALADSGPEETPKPPKYREPVSLGNGITATPLAASAIARFDRNERQRTQLSEHYVFHSHVYRRQGHI